MAKILIGCRLPNGLTLTSSVRPGERVTLKGVNTSVLLAPDGKRALGHYVTTEVDADFWTAWKAEYKDYVLLKNGSIFEAKNAADAADKADDLKDEKTGFEPIDPKFNGVAPADKEK